ncbi:hypothetical protein CH063_12449 [Colletotrichum higginsianum]|uniref:Uncharacterized protein n=2 Tax=Colletotrichum higginsianum TaxID=80884 RepID=H1VQE7_COLHI|nr:hypothetical protein CH63R_11369 [Colletotrichum higginsianum IMI 349063]OBR04666.1 hypothetical protein CH63R_11369 [Colletotrichum higginsianum IMI 349063]TIC93677.1 hypothetical protein CH35J_009101 [Colletotrichum higginsianum]GJC99304.1 hypothetical protein ColKHC_08130 [Colletotrichum higginsianum]CCF42453.1 hypothetical protein CH063_12449 [Colletotrichum higginsianum]
MPNSFDRLEKLFSRRKDLTIQTDQSMPDSTGPRGASVDRSFPQPSFIRPNVSRMKAREERIVASQNEKRAQSLPEAQSERISIHLAHLSSSSTTALTLPTRSMSLSHRRESQPVASLRGFDFPLPPTSPSSGSPFGSPKTLPTSHKVSLEHRHSSVILPPNRSHTPPGSDHDDDSSIKGSQGRPSSSLSRDLLTPAASPEMKPIHDTRSQDSAELCLAKRKAAAATTRRRREEKAAALRRPQGQSRPHRSITSPSQILKGGNVTDFFTLSDDDILEEEPEFEDAPGTPMTPAPLRLPPSPPTPASTVSSFRSKRRTSSIYTDDVAKEGALQVAQIAAKHKFDLIYIVNLWPESGSESSSPTFRSSMDFSSRPGSKRNSLLGPMEGPMVDSSPGMTGRLLAAYGLSNLTSPFRISATVQSKILKQEGWMEYRSDDAQAGEFARGYGHAFHTDTGRRGSTNSSPRSSSVRDISLNDHGIVFAAYRHPGKGSGAAGCTKEELEALRVDAEGLVDYLVAIHKARRLRDPMTLHTLIDEEATPS